MSIIADLEIGGVTDDTLKERNEDNTKFRYLHECQFWKIPNITYMQITTEEEERRRRKI